MRSTFTGIETAMRAINAMQLALDTTTHNIANANTPGYSRQRVELSASDPYTKPAMYRIPQPIQIGTGVNIDGITRARDFFADRQVRTASGELGNHETAVRYYNRIESLINEPSPNEFAGQLDRFWNAWSDLSLDPSDLSARTVVLEEGARIADSMNRTMTQLSELRTDAATEIDFVVSDVNDMAQEIADLNRDIRKLVGIGQTPNDLMDRRDMMIDDLARMTGASATYQADGTVDIMLDGRALVSGFTTDPLQTQAAGGGNVNIVWSSDLAAVALPQSELGALQTMNNTTIPDIQSDFNSFFNDLTAGVNTIHQAGYGLTDPAGAAGARLLRSELPEPTASTRRSSATRPSLVPLRTPASLATTATRW
ncbi:MAG: flagellar hook-associated protein FlgK [Thermomicrobiales bacterium]